MKSLEYFDPYNSYDLHWFPYEIYKCKKLKSSRISTRALYGNYKNRMGFPKLNHNPVRFDEDALKCSICEKKLTNETTNQMWITANVGTDIVPMLANLCSKECEINLPKPPENYVQFPHKGGANLVQPLSENELWEIEIAESDIEEREKSNEPEHDRHKNTRANNSSDKYPLLKLIRKIWNS